MRGVRTRKIRGWWLIGLRTLRKGTSTTVCGCECVCALCISAPWCLSCKQVCPLSPRLTTAHYDLSQGKFAAGSLSAACAECAIGEYQEVEGSLECSKCSFAKDYEDTEVVEYDGNRGTTLSTGSTSSADCKCRPGTYKGESSCVECGPGKFSEHMDSAECLVCGIGKYSSGICEDLADKPDKFIAGRRMGFGGGGGGTIHDMTCTEKKNGDPAGTCQELNYYGEKDDDDGLYFTEEQFRDTCCLCGKPLTLATSCSFCSPGSFNDVVTGVQDCKKCASGDGAVGAAREEQCIGFCGQGQQYDRVSQTCKACPAGTYKNSTANGFEQCSDCNDYIPGSTTSETGSEDRSDCKCKPGWKVDGTKCTECGVGKYSDAIAGSECLACPQGKAAHQVCKDGKKIGDTVVETDCSRVTTQLLCFDENQQECCACGGGVRDYTPTGQPSCSHCLPGTFKASASTSACADITGVCAHTPNYESDCSDCPAGKFSDRAGSSVDKCCAPGKVGNVQDCQGCEAGKYQSSSASSSCEDCPHIYQTSPAGSTAVSDCYVTCPAGTYAFNTSLCLDCPQNMDTASSSEYSASRDMIDDCKCSPGHASSGSGSSKSCEVCAIGTYKDNIADEDCTVCPADTSTEATGSDSEKLCVCSPGVSGSGGGQFAVCVQCAKGKFKKTVGTGQCKACSEGTFSDDIGSTTCTLCPAGKFENSKGKSACQLCLAGKYQSSTGSSHCIRCEPGKYASSGSSTGQSSNICTNCEGGMYSLQSEATSPAACEKCGNGTFSDPGSTGCTQCPVGKYSKHASEAGKKASDCVACLPGKYSTYRKATSNATCLDCAAGFYTIRAGQTICSICAPGKYAASGNNTGQSGTDVCTQCPIGTYSSAAGATADSTCVKCPTDLSTTLNTGSTSALECTGVCPPGQYAMNLNDTLCHACPQGFFKESTTHITASNCSKCPLGKFSPWGASECSSCVPGTYAGVNASPSCNICAAGSYSELGSALCNLCHGDADSVPGSSAQGCVCNQGYTGDGHSTCTECSATGDCPCKQNYFGDPRNPGGCEECPDNSLSPSGSSDMSQCTCNAGFYQEEAYDDSLYRVMHECVTCPENSDSSPGGHCECLAGYWRATSGHCLACPLLSTSNPGARPGLSACQCIAGYSMDELTGSCKTCSADGGCSCNGLYCNGDYCDGADYWAQVSGSTTASSDASSSSSDSSDDSDDDDDDGGGGGGGGMRRNRRMGGGDGGGDSSSDDDDDDDDDSTTTTPAPLISSNCSACPENSNSFANANSNISSCKCIPGFHRLGTSRGFHEAFTCERCPENSQPVFNASNNEWGCKIASRRLLSTRSHVSIKSVGSTEHAGASRSVSNYGGYGGNGGTLNPADQAKRAAIHEARFAAFASKVVRRRLMSTDAALYLELGEHATSICGFSNRNNTAHYGQCVGSEYSYLLVEGIPSQGPRAYAGTSFHLYVKKKDQYNQTMTSDSQSGVTVLTSLHGSVFPDASVTLAGQKYSELTRGEGAFVISLTPSYTRVTADGGGNTTMYRQPNIFLQGKDTVSSRWMISTIFSVDFNSGSHVCLPGSVLNLFGSAELEFRTGRCAVCKPGTYSLNPISRPPSAPIVSARFHDPSCLQCPAGGDCIAGGNSVSFDTGVWNESNSLYQLVKCPTGYKKINATIQEPDIFDHDVQICEMCDKGEECNLDSCEVCTLCEPGKFKSARSTEPCQECPANTYRMMPGARELANCLDCLPKSGTKGKKGQTHWRNCLCEDAYYRLVYDQITDECQVCPPGLICYGDDTMTKVVPESVWSTQDQIFRLDSCPYGYAVYNGNDGVFNAELQKCEMCDKGEDCIHPPCTNCTACAPGKFKSAKSTEPCQVSLKPDSPARKGFVFDDCFARF